MMFVRNSFVLFLIFFCVSCSQSEYCHMVIVSKSSQFSSEWLKFNGAAEFNGVKKISECQKLDLELDGGNGEKKGRVRWARCFSGPDCMDAGVR